MRKIPKTEWPPCCICGKPKAVCLNGLMYCNKHYLRMKKHGDVLPHPRKRTNTYKVTGEKLIITTAAGQTITADAEDYEKISKYSWAISKTGYAVARINKRTVKMHRYILDCTTDDVVDHINNNRLDNRKNNLRICSRADNCKNHSGWKTTKSGHVGITSTPYGKFNASITVNRNRIHVGNYDTIKEAVAARQEAESRYCGEYANHINKIGEE